MKKDFEIQSIQDAFLALNQIDESEVAHMIRPKKKMIEGRTYSLNATNAELEEARDFIKNDGKVETEIQVIDPDADSINHIKNKEQYVGQAILRCNRCKANRFIDVDKLVGDEKDGELYNVEDECPSCKTSGDGYELIGQVGKVDKPAEEIPEEPTAEEPAAEAEPETEGALAPEAAEEAPVEEVEEVEPVAVEEEQPAEELPEVEADEDPELALPEFEDVDKEEEANESLEENKEEEVPEEEPRKKLQLRLKHKDVNESLNEDDEIKIENDLFDKEPRVDNDSENNIKPCNDKSEIVGELIADEKEAIDGYDKALEDDCLSGEDKEELKHIRDEEKEHIEELADILADDDSDVSYFEDIEVEHDDSVDEMYGRDLLKEDANRNHYGEEAWMLGQIMQCMNDEEAYYGGWLYIWPDGETKEECMYDFGDEESYQELEDAFIREYEAYHDGGLYNAPEEVVKAAHDWDARLGLAPIENIVDECNITEDVDDEEEEDLEPMNIKDLLDCVVEPQNIDELVIVENGEELFRGVLDDMPDDFFKKEFTSFNVGQSKLNINVDTEDEESEDIVDDFLGIFDDEDTDQIVITDVGSSEALFEGTKEEVLDKFGNTVFVSIEAPEYLVIDITPIEDEEDTDDEDVEDVDEGYHLTWIPEAGDKVTVRGHEGIGTIDYVNSLGECFIKFEDGSEVTLSNKFGDIKPVRSAPMLMPEATENNNKPCSLFESICKANDLATYRANKIGTTEYWINETLNGECDDFDLKTIYETFVKGCGEALEYQYKKETGYRETLTENLVEPVVEAAEQEELSEEYNKKQVADLERLCKQYGIKTIQDLLRLCQELNEVDPLTAVRKYSRKVGQDFEIAEAKQDCCKSFKTRQELGEAIAECKNNNKPFRIERSKTEGYRYDLITDEALINTPVNLNVDLHDFGGDHNDVDVMSSLAEDVDDAEASKMDSAEDALEKLKADGFEIVAVADLEPVLDADIIDYMNQNGLELLVSNPSWARFFYFRNMNSLIGFLLNGGKFSIADHGKILGEALVNAPVDINIDAHNFGGSNNDVSVLSPGAGLLEDAPDELAPVEYTGLEDVVEPEEWTGEVDVLPAEETPATTDLVPADMSDIEIEIMNKIGRIAGDISDAIKKYYDIDADPALIVADILQDLKLIGGKIDVNDLEDTPINNATRAMFQDYNAMYDAVDQIMTELTGESIHTTTEEKLGQAIQMLDSPAFAPETIDKGIGSTRFLQAARAGQVPYIAANDLPMLEAAEEVDFDETVFEEALNKHLAEAYEGAVLYSTEKGTMNEKGVVTLEGLLEGEGTSRKVIFTLTPAQPLTENLETAADVAKAVHNVDFIVSNNLTDELFKYSFEPADSGDSCIAAPIKFANGRTANDIMAEFDKENKNEPFETRNAKFECVANWEYVQNMDFYVEHGYDVSNIKTNLLTDIDTCLNENLNVRTMNEFFWPGLREWLVISQWAELNDIDPADLIKDDAASIARDLLDNPDCESIMADENVEKNYDAYLAFINTGFDFQDSTDKMRKTINR